jgi:hypothetical protein
MPVKIKCIIYLEILTLFILQLYDHGILFIHFV